MVSEPQGGLAGLWSRAAADYEQSGAEFFGPLAQELVTRARLRPGDRVLDIGTGRGHVLFAAAEAVGPEGSVTGIDLAAEMVRLTAAEINERGLGNATVEVGDAAHPSLPPASVDALLAGFMVFLLPDPQAAFRSYRELLASPGRLAFSTYGEEDPQLLAVRAQLRDLAGTTGPARDVFDNTEATGELVRAAGFDDVLTAEVTIETRFDDLGQWWRWAWSVGIRGTLERIDPAALDQARPTIEQDLTPWRQPDGTYLMPTAIRFTTAST